MIYVAHHSTVVSITDLPFQKVFRMLDIDYALSESLMYMTLLVQKTRFALYQTGPIVEFYHTATHHCTCIPNDVNLCYTAKTK